MREIKFRAWDVGNNRFHYFTLGPGDFFIDRNWIIMQSTGLMDKQNNEIFEGDILMGCNGITKRTSFKTVKWYSSDAFWGLEKDGFHEALGDALNSQVGSTYEVVGNIYEHPDLAKTLL